MSSEVGDTEDMSEASSGESQVIEVSYLHTTNYATNTPLAHVRSVALSTASHGTTGSTTYQDEPLPPLPDLPVLNLDDDDDDVDGDADSNNVAANDNREVAANNEVELGTAELVKLISSESIGLTPSTSDSATTAVVLYSDSSASPIQRRSRSSAVRSASYVIHGTNDVISSVSTTATTAAAAAAPSAGADLQIDSARAGLGGEFAGDSFYDSDDYVLQQNAIRAATSFAQGYDDVDQVAVQHQPLVMRSVEDEVYGTFAELVKGNYAAISLVQSETLHRSNYQRLLTDQERESSEVTQYDSIEIPRSNYQRLHTDSELYEIAAAAAAAAGKPKLAYVQLPAEPGSKPGSGALRHSSSEARISEARTSARRDMSPAEREARANYGELPKKQPDIAAVAAAHAALVSSSPDAFGSTSPKLSGASSPTSSASPTSPMVASSRSARLRRIDRRNLPSLSTMRNGDIACEQCRSTAFAHKLPLETGRVMLLCDACLDAHRQESRTNAALPAYGQLPVKALEAQRSDLIAAIGRIETAWGRRPKDGATVLELTRLQQTLTDTESQIRRLGNPPLANPDAVASTATTAAPLSVPASPIASSPPRAGAASPPPRTNAASPPPPPPAGIEPAPMTVSDTMFVQRFGTVDLELFQAEKRASAHKDITDSQANKKNKTFIVKPSDANKQFAPSLAQISAAKSNRTGAGGAVGGGAMGAVAGKPTPGPQKVAPLSPSRPAPSSPLARSAAPAAASPAPTTASTTAATIASAASPSAAPRAAASPTAAPRSAASAAAAAAAVSPRNAPATPSVGVYTPAPVGGTIRIRADEPAQSQPPAPAAAAPVAGGSRRYGPPTDTYQSLSLSAKGGHKPTYGELTLSEAEPKK